MIQILVKLLMYVKLVKEIFRIVTKQKCSQKMNNKQLTKKKYQKKLSDFIELALLTCLLSWIKFTELRKRERRWIALESLGHFSLEKKDVSILLSEISSKFVVYFRTDL